MPEATSQFHGGSKDTDYQGRSWLECPSDLKAQSALATTQSYIPKSCVHTWTGHTAGVHAIRWFPKTGHLLLSASMDNKVNMYVCMYVCIHTYIHMYIYISVYIHTYIYVYMYVCMYVCMYIYICI